MLIIDINLSLSLKMAVFVQILYVVLSALISNYL